MRNSTSGSNNKDAIDDNEEVVVIELMPCWGLGGGCECAQPQNDTEEGSLLEY